MKLLPGDIVVAEATPWFGAGERRFPVFDVPHYVAPSFNVIDRIGEKRPALVLAVYDGCHMFLTSNGCVGYRPWPNVQDHEDYRIIVKGAP